MTAIFQGTDASIDGLGSVTSGVPISTAPINVDTWFTLRVSTGGGIQVSQPVFIHVIGPPTLQSFTASPSSIGVGSSSTLRWTTGGDIEAARLEPGGFDVTGLSSFVVTPAATTTYVLHLSNQLASASGSVQVEALPAAGRIDSFVAAPVSTTLRGSVQLAATFDGAGQIAKQGDDGIYRVLGPLTSGGTLSSGELLRTTMFELQVRDARGLYTTQRLEVVVTGPGTFRPTIGQPVAEAWRATRLLTGKVLISGAGTTQIFDPLTETFTPGPTMLGFHSATLMGDGRVLLAIDWGAGAPRLQIYDPTANAISEIGNTTRAHLEPAIALSDGRVAFVAAATGVAIFDPVAEVFGPVFPAFPPADTLQRGELLPDGRVLFITGAPTRPAQVFSPLSGLFTVSSASFTNRHSGFSTIALADGRVLVNGGFVADTQAAEIYHPDTDSVTFAGSQNSPNVWNQRLARLANGLVLVSGGHGTDVSSTYNYSYSSAHLFDPATGLFAQTGGMRTGRRAHAAVLLEDGRVLVVGGCNALPCEAEIYTP